MEWDPKKFAYTFDPFAEILNFTEAFGLSRYKLSMQDYGAPVGFRIRNASFEHEDDESLARKVCTNHKTAQPEGNNRLDQ